MELLSVVEAATQKACSAQAVRDAIAKGKIKGRQIGRSFVVQADKSFADWQPNLKRQKGALSGWKDRKPGP